MAYAPYVVRVIARATITKSSMGLGTPEEIVLAYPETEQSVILEEIYKMRPNLQPAQ